MIKGHRRSRKDMEGHGRSFPITILTFQVRKVMGGGWTLDFEFGTCILDLDLGLDLGLTIFSISLVSQ